MLPIIAITMGDPAGVGPEISVKALTHKEMYDLCTPFIIGDYEAVKDALAYTHNEQFKIREISSPQEAKGEFGTIDLFNMGFLKPNGWEYKKVSRLTGDAAYRYVEKSIEFANAGLIHGVATGPINKEAINLAGHHYSGHTEIFATLTNTKNYAMLLCSRKLKAIHVTTHVAMRDACDLITKDRVLNVIHLADEAIKLMGIKEPRIAVAGLNAHCSENGMFGFEEERSIIPAVQAAQQEGIHAEGPIPPDTVFVKAMAQQYDIVVAMYHDQGHIPVKMSGFELDLKTNTFTSLSGINMTVGLPIIRTSVDHGTAFDRAGDGIANEESMIEALEVASQMAVNKFSL